MIDRRQADLQARHAQSPEAYLGDIPFEKESESVELKDYLAIFSRRLWLMLLVMVVTIVSGLIYTFTRKPIYEASARVVAMQTSNQGIPVSENDIPLISDLHALTRSRTVETQVEIMSSPDLIEEAYQSLPRRMQRAGFGEENIPRWAYKVKAQRNTDVILVTGKAYTPDAAAMLANTIADTYFRRDLEQNNQATKQARMFAGEQMLVAERDLSKANAELAAFKRKTSFFAPNEQLAEAAQRTAKLAADLTEAKAEAAAKRRTVGVLSKELSSEQKNVVTSTTLAMNPQYNASLEKIDSLNSERAALLQEYTPESREVKAVENRIREEEARLKKVAETVVSSTVQSRNPVRDTLSTQYAGDLASLSAANARVVALESEFQQHEKTTLTLPEKERQLAQLSERVALLQRTYEMLSSKYYALLLREQSTLPSGMLVSRAKLADEPAYPKPVNHAALFVIAGALLAVVAALVAERLDSRVRDEETVERLCRLNTLTMIPRIKNDSPQIANNNRDPQLLESFRILRNNISLTPTERPAKVLAVTSPGRREGKSTVSINLATALAMEGKRVILVDGDMRCPSIHRYLGLSNEAGLSDVLTNTVEMENAIIETGISNVQCLPAGQLPSNPSELLNSERSREVFKTLAERYDAVIVDSPPAVGLSDVQVISTITDALLLVVSMNQTLKPYLQIALKTLAQVDAPLIGAALNGTNLSRKGYGYYYSADKAALNGSITKAG